MRNEKIEDIKLIVDLTLAKVEILKLKADDYTWQCYMEDSAKEGLLSALEDIDALIGEIRKTSTVEAIN